MVVQPEVYFSRWWPLPSSISKSCCHFFGIWPIVAKISGDIGPSIWNISMTSEKQIFENSRSGSPPYWIPKNWILGFRKAAAIHLVFDRSSLKLVETLGLRFGTYRWRKMYTSKNQDGGRRHLGFRKTAAISLLFDLSSPKLMETFGLRFRTYRWRRKCILEKFKMAVVAIATLI